MQEVWFQVQITTVTLIIVYTAGSVHVFHLGSLHFTFCVFAVKVCSLVGYAVIPEPRLGRQRQVWLIPIAYERVGVQVKL